MKLMIISYVFYLSAIFSSEYETGLRAAWRLVQSAVVDANTKKRRRIGTFGVNMSLIWVSSHTWIGLDMAKSLRS